MSSAIWILVLLLLQCLIPIAGAQDYITEFTAMDCPALIQQDAGDDQHLVTCGRALVPENRSAPENGSLVNLFVLRIQPKGHSANAPILHLAGDPATPHRLI